MAKALWFLEPTSTIKNIINIKMLKELTGDWANATRYSGTLSPTSPFKQPWSQKALIKQS